MKLVILLYVCVSFSLFHTLLLHALSSRVATKILRRFVRALCEGSKNLRGIFVATLTQKESEIANGFNEEPSETVKIVSDYQVCLTARQDSITFQNSIKGVVKGGKLIQNISFEKSLISLEFTKILSD